MDLDDDGRPAFAAGQRWRERSTGVEIVLTEPLVNVAQWKFERDDRGSGVIEEAALRDGFDMMLTEY
jgi:hypothetical protein